MEGELECKGKVKVGQVPWDISERLTQFSGNWLEFDPAESAIVVRHTQPGTCPALSGVPCELITIIDSIPQQHRDCMPGGALYVKDRQGQAVRLVVEHGEVRVQWPHLDYSRAVPVTPEVAMQAMSPSTARVRGWARFAGSPAKAAQLQDFVDRFEGLYPEGDMPSECQSDMVYVEFRDVNVGPDELIAKLKELAEPHESLQAEMEVGSFVAGATDQDFRICIRDGRVQMLRPALWSEG
jgi:hypothetical protein